MRKSKAEALAAGADPIDEQQFEATEDSERLEEQRLMVDEALEQISSENERDADKVIAFRKFVIQRQDNAEIAKEMGRSNSWVTKAHLRIAELLKDRLRTSDQDDTND